MAWTRTKLITLDSLKIRHVWFKAFHNILLEGMSAAPLIEAYSGTDFPMCTGFQYYKKLPQIIQNVLLKEGD